MALWVCAKKPSLSVVSPYLAERWKREMWWRRDVAVIPNIAPFGPHHARHDGQGCRRVTTVADSSRLKNVKAALQAWPLVLRSFPDAELHLVGHGLGSSDDLAIWANQHSLRRQVSWHGAVGRSEVERLIGSSAALLHPSLEESQGLVLLEAMALGVPVVGGEGSGAVPWTIGKAGVLADVRSPTALAEAVLELLKDPQRRAELGEAGTRRVSETFSPDAVAGAYERQYAAVLNEKRR